MHLFVYGTLLSAIPSSMSKFLRRRASLVGKATVSGSLHDLGMYPGFKAGGSGTVTGELYELKADQQARTLEMLDAYEGVTGEKEDEYARKTVTCSLEDGRTFKADTYVSKSIPSGKPTIPAGKYASFYKSNKEHQRFVNGG